MDMAANTYLYEALTVAGIQPDGARKVERAIETVIDEHQNKALGNVMTKEDGANLGATLRTEVANVRTEVANVRTEVANVRTEIATMNATLLKEQKAQMAWFVTLMFIAVGAATGGVELLHRLWP